MYVCTIPGNKVFELYRLGNVKWKNDDQGIYMDMTLCNM